MNSKSHNNYFLSIVITVYILFPILFAAQIELNGISSWAYQLQNIDIEEIANNNTFELIVIDYSSDGSDEGKFTQGQINAIKASDKIVLSYISIGEAENYRYYWNDSWDANNDGQPDANAPSWLGPQNPDWEGNYKVKFWQSEWQSIIFDYIDKIMAQGFDGIYCDIIDAYYYWSEENPVKSDAAVLMIDFLEQIRSHVTDDFLIFPQNGEFIIEEDGITEELQQDYFNSISAIGVEDVFFIGDDEKNNPYDPDQERISVLNQFTDHGKPVFSVEYITDQNSIETFYAEATQQNFIPYSTVRALDQLSPGVLTSVENRNSNLNEFSLSQNYPNPFNPSTKIEYTIPSVGTSRDLSLQRLVTLKLYDILGNEIATLVNETKPPGSYEVEFDGSHFPSGIYFYRLTFGNYTDTKKMLLLK